MEQSEEGGSGKRQLTSYMKEWKMRVYLLVRWTISLGNFSNYENEWCNVRKTTQVKVPSRFIREEEYNVSHIWTGNVTQFRAERLAKVLWSNETTQRLWWRPLQLALVWSSSSSDAKLTSLLGAPLEDQAPLHSRTDFHLLYSKMILQISPGKSL